MFHFIPVRLPFHVPSARLLSGVHLDEGTVDLHGGISDVPACRTTPLNMSTCYVCRYSIPFHLTFHSIPYLPCDRPMYNQMSNGSVQMNAACTASRAHRSHPLIGHPVMVCQSTIPFHSIPFRSIPVSFHPAHSSDLSRSSQTGEGGGRAVGVCVCTRCDLVWSSHSAPKVTIPFHSISRSIPFHVVLPHKPSCLLVYSHWSRTAWTQQTG